MQVGSAVDTICSPTHLKVRAFFVTLIRVDAHSVFICNREIIWTEADQGCSFLFVNLVVLLGFLVALFLLQIQLLCDFLCMKLSFHCSCFFMPVSGRLAGIGVVCLCLTDQHLFEGPVGMATTTVASLALFAGRHLILACCVCVRRPSQLRCWHASWRQL